MICYGQLVFNVIFVQVYKFIMKLKGLILYFELYIKFNYNLI